MSEAQRSGGSMTTQTTAVSPMRTVKRKGTFANGNLPTVADRDEITRHQEAAQLGIIEPGKGDVMQLIPFSSGAADATITMEVYGVREVEDGTEKPGSKLLRVPILLFKATVTLGSREVNGGTARGAYIPASAKYAKSISITENEGMPPNQVRKIEPTTVADGVASLIVDLMGCAYGIVTMKSGDAGRACNCFYVPF